MRSKTWRNLLILGALLFVLGVDSGAFSGPCPSQYFDNSYCDCTQDDVYCDYFPDTCPSDFCDKVDAWCASKSCSNYGCWVYWTDCEGFCIGCPS